VKKMLLVARWEFLTTVKRRAYIFAVLAMPGVFILLMIASVFSGRSMLRGAVGGSLAVVDPAGIVDLAFAAELDAARSPGAVELSNPIRLKRYDALEPALEALRAGNVSAVYALDPNYVATGRVTGYALQSTGSFGQALIGRRQGAVADAIRASLLRTRVDAEALARVYAPMARFEVRTVAMDGDVGGARSRFALNTFLGSVAIVLLLTIAIFFSAGFLQQATTEDRQNRVIEVLLSSTTSDQLLLGKIIGLGGAGLLQLAVYIILVIVPGATIAAVFTVPLVPFLLSLVYFVIGYLLYAALMGGTGMLGRTPQEGAQLSALWTFTAASPLFFLPMLAASPDSTFAKALSFFPLTSPVAMILRLTSGRVELLDIVASILIGVVSVYFALRAASKIFRAASLMYGKRATLGEVLRWLRAA
jgi:ABC-2 type transport system permease protein